MMNSACCWTKFTEGYENAASMQYKRKAESGCHYMICVLTALLAKMVTLCRRETLSLN